GHGAGCWAEEVAERHAGGILPGYLRTTDESPYEIPASITHCAAPAAIGAQPALPSSAKLVCRPTPAMPTHRSHRSPRWINSTHSFGSQPVLLSAAKTTNITRNHGTGETCGLPACAADRPARSAACMRHARPNTTGASSVMRTSFTTVAMAVDSLAKPDAAATTCAISCRLAPSQTP